MPIIFVAIGAILGPQGLVLAKSAELLTEMTPALLLFADASTLNFRQVRDDARLPGRLLLIAMPLVIALGDLVAYGLFPGEELGFALLLATILAPTAISIIQTAPGTLVGFVWWSRPLSLLNAELLDPDFRSKGVS